VSETNTLPADLPPPADEDASPMMVQYLAIKRSHPDSLLFYRMGDFYEMFFEDAVAAAQALDITLTKRGRHAGQDIPMCGVPVHSHEGYLSRLIRKGFKVAVCEQMEDPAEARKRGSKSVVERQVIRLVTPGTLTEDALLDARSHNYLAALAEAQGSLGLAWLDMSTGDFQIQPVGLRTAAAAVARLAPGELLVPERLMAMPELADLFRDCMDILSPLPSVRFDSVNARKRLETLYGVRALDGFGAFGRAELAAGGALIDYVELTQKGRLPRLGVPKRLAEGAVMEIDMATRRNLELSETLTGERRGSLLSVIDRTVTGAGARLLAQHLAAPLTDPAAIGERLDMVQFFVDHHSLRDGLQNTLKACPDIERALSRLTLGRGGPRDLAAIRDALAAIPAVRGAFARTDFDPLPAGLTEALAGLGEHGALAGQLAAALAEELPVLTRDGGFIRAGYHADLDQLKQLRDDSRRLIAALQGRYAEASGVAALKIKHNNVLGYYIEVPPKQAERMGDPFIHRQTIASGVRFTTVELGELEDKIRSAADKALALELELFAALVADVVATADPLADAARALARLDVAAGLAALAADRRYARPVVEEGFAFEITAGRHPVVEAGLEGTFIANHCDLAPTQRLWLITGPNMAGKSTFLRQNALIAILAQMGSFVPAEAARIGIVDRLFSRVGAADDLARGRSTFMVEMVETAAILNQAGPRALVILDEIGRGTATFDGLSIAWAVVEHLHEVNHCRALFATHYHELTALAAKLSSLACHCMRVKEWKGEVVFLHEVGAGTADRSYGIHVARLAGLPAAVIDRAEAVLHTLEKGEQSSAVAKLADDLPLFAAAARHAVSTPSLPAGPTPMEQALAEADPDALTPRQALDLVYRLKGMV
jgi:DNA mismatch repair protein MutS